jgi:hypothetical protein
MGKYEASGGPSWLAALGAWMTRSRRKRLYLAMLGLGAVAVLYGAMTADQVDAWARVLVQLLGLTAPAVAVANLPVHE